MVIRMKTLEMDATHRQLVEKFSALANPARLRILEVLSQHPQSIVSDIVAQLPLAQATVSQHLRVLQRANLIHDERAGAGTCCRLNIPELTKLIQELVAWAIGLADAAGTPCGEGKEQCKI
jgi:DNA-binding transcriptional ArsR family regulator